EGGAFTLQSSCEDCGWERKEDGVADVHSDREFLSGFRCLMVDAAVCRLVSRAMVTTLIYTWLKSTLPYLIGSGFYTVYPVSVFKVPSHQRLLRCGCGPHYNRLRRLPTF